MKFQSPGRHLALQFPHLPGEVAVPFFPPPHWDQRTTFCKAPCKNSERFVSARDSYSERPTFKQPKPPSSVCSPSAEKPPSTSSSHRYAISRSVTVSERRQKETRAQVLRGRCERQDEPGRGGRTKRLRDRVVARPVAGRRVGPAERRLALLRSDAD